MPDFLVFATALPKLFGSRVVAYMHEPSPELAESLFGPGPREPALARVEQLVLRFADHSIAVTDQLKERYVERGARPEGITVVLNGADPGVSARRLDAAGLRRRRRARSRSSVTARSRIATARTRSSRLPRILKPELPDLRVVIVGRGKATDALVAQIAETETGDVVSFEGWVSDERLREVLHSADVGIVAQKATPYSHLVSTNKMVDYWIFGLPVIASRLRAVSELCDESTLEFYEPGDPRGPRAGDPSPPRRPGATRGARTKRPPSGEGARVVGPAREVPRGVRPRSWRAASGSPRGAAGRPARGCPRRRCSAGRP